MSKLGVVIRGAPGFTPGSTVLIVESTSGIRLINRSTHQHLDIGANTLDEWVITEVSEIALDSVWESRSDDGHQVTVLRNGRAKVGFMDDGGEKELPIGTFLEVYRPVIEQDDTPSYASLNDASVTSAGLKPGNTEVWYMKPTQFAAITRRMLMGEPVAFSKADLGKTHVLLGKVAETDPERIFMALQGERWSPNGEATALLKKLKLGHTSMSSGDVVVFRGRVYVAAPFGFTWDQKGKEEAEVLPTRTSRQLLSGNSMSKGDQIMEDKKTKVDALIESVRKGVIDGKTAAHVLQTGESATRKVRVCECPVCESLYEDREDLGKHLVSDHNYDLVEAERAARSATGRTIEEAVDSEDDDEDEEDMEEMAAAFTKRHYIAIAKLFKRAKNLKQFKEDLIDIFAQDNPNFDEDRFRTAAAMEDGDSEDEEESALECPDCDTVFEDSDSLILHLCQEHGYENALAQEVALVQEKKMTPAEKKMQQKYRKTAAGKKATKKYQKKSSRKGYKVDKSLSRASKMGARSRPEGDETAEENEEPTLFECPECGVMHEDGNGLSDHLIHAHGYGSFDAVRETKLIEKKMSAAARIKQQRYRRSSTGKKSLVKYKKKSSRASYRVDKSLGRAHRKGAMSR